MLIPLHHCKYLSSHSSFDDNPTKMKDFLHDGDVIVVSTRSLPRTNLVGHLCYNHNP